MSFKMLTTVQRRTGSVLGRNNRPLIPFRYLSSQKTFNLRDFEERNGAIRSELGKKPLTYQIEVAQRAWERMNGKVLNKLEYYHYNAPEVSQMLEALEKQELELLELLKGRDPKELEMAEFRETLERSRAPTWWERNSEGIGNCVSAFGLVMGGVLIISVLRMR